MTKTIFRKFFALIVVLLLSSSSIIMFLLYDYFGRVEETRLDDELMLAASFIAKSDLESLKRMNFTRYRLSLIDDKGEVLYDSHNEAGEMENHGDRKEVREALKYGSARSVRYSSTLLEQTIYKALRLEDGSVLRLSLSRASASKLAFGMLAPLAAILALSLVSSLFLAKRLARSLVKPLNDLNLDEPLENDCYDEVGPLLNRIHQQQKSLLTQNRQLEKKQDEFRQLIENMREGLVILDKDGNIVSMNASALRFFEADEAALGFNFLSIERSLDIKKALDMAAAEGRAELRIERSNFIYQLSASRIEFEASYLGLLILLFDITDRELFERKRREFTANISHELKTPLQTIIGGAELLELGMLKKEDEPHFIARIKKEARRLLKLIEMSIGLAALDEGRGPDMEELVVLDLAEEIMEDLRVHAELRKVKMRAEGERVSIKSSGKLLRDIIYNLLDNAIKYSFEGGTVSLVIAPKGDGLSIVVRDRGVGIPKAEQNRIFERFYRVDKSHSKETGGTGLGLSIVKHAVMELKGSIELRSEEGHGTEIKVFLPFL